MYEYIDPHIKSRTHIPNKRGMKIHQPVWCLLNEFVKNCLTSTHVECEQTNRHTVVGAKHSLAFAQLPTSEGMLQNTNEDIRHCSVAFVYHPHILILDKRMHFFAIRSPFVQYMCTQFYLFAYSHPTFSTILQE